jgi:hypothetical protein
VRGVGEDGSEQTAADIVEDAEDETGEYGPHRPYEITPIRADVGQAEQEGGDHQAKLLLDGAPEKRFLTNTREDRNQHEVRRVGAVDQPRGELRGDLTQGKPEGPGRRCRRRWRDRGARSREDSCREGALRSP